MFNGYSGEGRENVLTICLVNGVSCFDESTNTVVVSIVVEEIVVCVGILVFSVVKVILVNSFEGRKGDV